MDIVLGVVLLLVVVYGLKTMVESANDENICPNCGYYCTGKSVYCLPPKKE